MPTTYYTWESGVPTEGTGAAGAVTRVGGNTTEATTTSVTKVDILTLTGLNIAASAPVLVLCNIRKTAGAANQGFIGLDTNNANTLTWNNSLYSSGTNRAEDAHVALRLEPRFTNYINGVGITCVWHVSSGTAVANDRNASIVAGVLPTAAITDIDITGGVGDALITAAADEMQVYTFAVS